MIEHWDIPEIQDRSRVQIQRSGEERRADYDPFGEVRRYIKDLLDENAQGWALARYWEGKARRQKRTHHDLIQGLALGFLFGTAHILVVLWLF